MLSSLSWSWSCRSTLARLRHRRLWACLVAEAPGPSLDPVTQPSSSSHPPLSDPQAGQTGLWQELHDGDVATEAEVAGFLILSLSQPLALLPPPFPSSSPRALKVDSLAVSSHHQGRGIGRALLCAAERLGRLMGMKGHRAFANGTAACHDAHVHAAATCHASCCCMRSPVLGARHPVPGGGAGQLSGPPVVPVLWV